MEPELKEAITGVTGDLAKFIEKHGVESTETKDRLHAIEQKLSKSQIANQDYEEAKTIGQRVVEHPQFKQFLEGGFNRSGRIPVGTFFQKSAILTTSDTAPLAQRIAGVVAGRPQLRLRDFLSVVPCTSDHVEFVKLVAGGSTNAAAPQGRGSSPAQTQGYAKAESAMAFALASEPIVTVAHWIPASRQVISDNASLAAWVNSQMLFWLRQREEDQILNGITGDGDLNGLFAQGTAYDSSLDEVGDTRVDTVRHARTQLELAGYSGNVFVLNPRDLETIELTKTSVASGGGYIVGDPGSADSLWGMNPVSSAAVNVGNFVAFDSRAVYLYDRMQAVVEISREHSDFFTRNLLAILAELREALVVPDVLAVVQGTFPQVSP